MKKMNIPYLTLRILSVLSYFLPFTFYLATCASDPGRSEAYNKEDAIRNEKRENQKKLDDINASINQIDTIKAANNVPIIRQLTEKVNRYYYRTDNIVNLDEDIGTEIYLPTRYSASAIGLIIIGKSLLGVITVVISIFLSLITLILWRVFTKRRIGIYVISANILTISIFIIDCYFSKITILYGAWVLLSLLFAQLLTEINLFKINRFQQLDSNT